VAVIMPRTIRPRRTVKLVVAIGCAAAVAACGSGRSPGTVVSSPHGAKASDHVAADQRSQTQNSAVVPGRRRGAGFGSHWTTYHGTAEATGVQAAHTTLLPSRRAWTSSRLDGQLYGEPLVAEGRVIAATENNTVYVMAARSGRILWSRHLAKPVPSGDLPCGDISPNVGITGTPVIDTERHEIFVDADTVIRGPSASGGVEASHRLFGLDLFTGKVELDEPAMPNTGEDQLAQLQRPGLALDHGFVVIAYGQNTGDCPGPNGPAHGYVVSIPETGGPLHYFQIGKGRDRGAVWMGGSSPVVDPHGNVYVASADGSDLGRGQRYDDSDAVLELSATMRLKSIFYTNDWQQLSADDRDLGTGDPALVHGFVLQVGKTDVAYLLRQGNLGGADGQVASLSLCSGDPDGGHAVKGSVVYLPCPNGVTAVRVSTKPPHLKQLWTDSDGAAGAPIIADGLVWTIGSDNAVHGLNPANGKQVVSIPFGASANHFPTPSVGDGLLLLPGTDQVFAFMGPAGRPPVPPAR
jgi:outer membrane protein assembly factor BamB